MESVTEAVPSIDMDSVLRIFAEHLAVHDPDLIHATDDRPEMDPENDLFVAHLTDLEAQVVLYRESLSRSIERIEIVIRHSSYLRGIKLKEWLAWYQDLYRGVTRIVHAMYESRFPDYAGYINLFIECAGNRIVVPDIRQKRAQTIKDVKKGFILPPDL